MSIELRPASSLPAPDLAALFNRCYEGYFVPMQLDESALRGMARLVHGDEAFAALGAQIAGGNHPFEGREDASVFWRIFRG